MTILATDLLAASHGGGMHMVLLAVILVVGLIAFAIIWMRRRRETAEGDQFDQPPTAPKRGRSEKHERSSSDSPRH